MLSRVMGEKQATEFLLDDVSDRLGKLPLFNEAERSSWKWAFHVNGFLVNFCYFLNPEVSNKTKGTKRYKQNLFFLKHCLM